MDNNFDHEFYHSQPQKPFNEKIEEVDVNGQPVSFSFQPEKPLMQKNEPQFGTEQESEKGFANEVPPQPQPFNPIEHTATYADNRFIDNQQPPQPYAPNQGYYPPNTQPMHRDYSNPMYYNPNSQPVQGGMSGQYAYPYHPYADNTPNHPAYQSPYSPANPIPAVNPFEARPASPQREDAFEKPKANKGLIIVIIVLSLMLAASLGGILYYAISATNDSVSSHMSDSQNGTSGNQDIPEMVIPTMPSTQETVPQNKHEESDYSDKIDKNYKGLALESKPDDKDSAKYSSEYAYSKASDSVVSIACYLDEESGSATSQGSGIIISSDGYIVTNSHVIGDSKNMYAIKVITTDGKEYKAGVVGFDARTDIAVLKVDNIKNLKAASFGDSDKLVLGEDIIVIGCPGGIGYQNSMTKGVVSAIDREVSSKSIVKYIQTDAAINPGNSGGPAVNNYGQVVGIASAKIVDEKYEGMGFCIPSATAKGIIESLIKNGYVAGRVKIGITGVAVTSAEAQVYGLPRGIAVQSVDPDGPCGKADLQQDDIITKFDGKELVSFSDIYTQLESCKAGDKVKLTIYRTDNNGSGKEFEIEVTLQEDK